MRRRDLLTTLAAAAATASAGCNAVGTFTSNDDDADDTQEAITVETLDAPGSQAGTTTVPAAERVSFVEFFATTCSICAAQMSTLVEAYRRVGDEVQFLSVTSEPVGYTVTKEEVASWWDDHGGTWPVAVDDGTALSHRYGATSVPTAVVVRPDGTVTWSHTGRTEASDIVDAIRDATDGDQP